MRGTLRATQNRLEHTQNNLSVMTENIQDAESTIRDTDVADEMMAYTKNNILVQSAAAMLAQANQVPQGVPAAAPVSCIFSVFAGHTSYNPDGGGHFVRPLFMRKDRSYEQRCPCTGSPSGRVGPKETAQQAYTLVLQQSDGSDPAAEMEAASYIFFSEGEYQTAYTTFCFSVQPRILSSGIDGSDDAGLLSAQCGSAAEMLSGKL